MSLSKLLPLLQNYDALLVANGSAPSKPLLKLLRQCSAALIAVDGGVNTLAANKIVPDFVIGDFDSATPQSLNWAKRHRAKIIEKKTQEVSDFYESLEFCQKKGFRKIAVVAVDGCRLDHTLSALGSLFEFPKIKATLFTNSTLCFPLAGAVSLKVSIPKNYILSWFPFGQARGCSLKGVEWPFANRTLTSNFFSLSNIPKANEISLKQSSGKSLFVINFKP